MAQYAAMRALADHPEASASELARLCFVTRQSLQDLLVGLRSAGFVREANRPPRGRARSLELTRVGAKRLADAHSSVMGVEASMLQGICPVRNVNWSLHSSGAPTTSKRCDRLLAVVCFGPAGNLLDRRPIHLRTARPRLSRYFCPAPQTPLKKETIGSFPGASNAVVANTHEPSRFSTRPLMLIMLSFQSFSS